MRFCVMVATPLLTLPAGKAGSAEGMVTTQVGTWVSDCLVLASQAFYLRQNAGGFQIWKCYMILSWEETAALFR